MATPFSNAAKYQTPIFKAHVRIAAEALAPLVEKHDVVITHGNGPQVGVLALESEADAALSRPYPFDALVAETQGLIGNWLLAAIEHAAPGHEAVCLLTRTLVDAADPAFSAPTKFVGPLYTERQASKLSRRHGWSMRQDGTIGGGLLRPLSQWQSSNLKESGR